MEQNEHVLAVLGTRPMDEHNRGMYATSRRRDQRPGQLNLAIRKPHVFALFDVDAPCCARRRARTLPGD